METVYALLGPTASGKTDLAMHLVQSQDFEIISVDSAMIYKDMDIGTAKPLADELKLAPHRLIDFLDPADIYSVAQFCIDVKNACEEIFAKGKKPLLVGGTMMYFQALKLGLADLPSRDDSIRQRLQTQITENGLDQLHQQLQNVDPDAAAKIKAGDLQRIIRALEVFEMTGEPLSVLQKNTQGALPYHIKAVSLLPEDRSWLHQRIEQRFDLMLEAGLIEEVQTLKNRGDLNLEMPSMRCVGYRQVWQYLNSECDLSEMREKGMAATRQLAKRQITWLRGFDWVRHIDPCDSDLYDQVQKYFLKELS